MICARYLFLILCLFEFSVFAENSIQTIIRKSYQGNDLNSCTYGRTLICTDTIGKILYEEESEGFSTQGNLQWNNLSRIENTFDSINQLVRLTYSGSINNSWLEYYRIEYSYNSQGNLISEVRQNFNSGFWSDYSKVEFLYNLSDSIISRKEFRYNAGIWQVTKDEERNYDSNDDLISYLILYDQNPNDGLDTSRYDEYLHEKNSVGADTSLYSFTLFPYLDTLLTVYNYDFLGRLSSQKLVRCPSGICNDSLRAVLYGYLNISDTLGNFENYRSGLQIWETTGYFEHIYNLNGLDSSYSLAFYDADGYGYYYIYDSLNRPFFKQTESHADNFHPSSFSDFNYHYSMQDSLYAVCYQPFKYCFPDSGIVIFSIVGGFPPYTIDIGSRTIQTDNGGAVYLDYLEYLSQPFTYRIIDSIGQLFIDTVSLDIPQPAHTSIEILGRTEFCPGDSITLQASFSSFNHSWRLNSQQIGYSDSVTIDTSGTLILTTYIGVANSGCGPVIRLTDTIIITRSNPIQSQLGSDTLLCYNQSIELSPGSDFSTYQWQDGSTDSTILISHSSGSIDTLLYSVLTSDSNGCFTSDTIQVIFDICSKIPKLVESDLIIWPNPADNYLNIEGDSNGGELIIKSILGQILMQSELNNRIRVECSDWQEGMYFIEIRSGRNKIVKKILILHP